MDEKLGGVAGLPLFLEFFAVMFIPTCLGSFPLLEILSVPLAVISNENSFNFIDVCVSVRIYCLFFAGNCNFNI